MEKRACPFCESTHLRRSRRRNLFERAILSLFSARPYRCMDCNRRFYAGVSPRSGEPSGVSLEASAGWGAAALVLFFAVPVVVGARFLHDRAAPTCVALSVDAVDAPARAPVRFAPAIGSAAMPELRLAGTRPETSAKFLLRQGAEQRTPVGSLQVTGPVSINGSPATGDTTVFTGDVIRTGADGAARITVAGNGTLILSAQTELVLSGAPRYLATLRSGVLGIYSLTGARSFQVRVGNYLVVPAPDAPATAEVRLAPDGSAEVTCQNGSVGILALEGEEVTFLSAGETARIGPAGTLAPPEPPAPTQPPPQPPRGGGGVNKGVVIVILVGGGAAGAALALGRSKEKQAQPVSPFVP